MRIGIYEKPVAFHGGKILCYFSGRFSGHVFVVSAFNRDKSDDQIFEPDFSL